MKQLVRHFRVLTNMNELEIVILANEKKHDSG